MARKPVRQPVQDVADYGPGRRRDHAYDLGKVGKAPLARCIEQPFPGQLFLALLKQGHERANACGR